MSCRDTRPEPATVPKYPLIDAAYRVVGHTNMYVLGAAAHSLDYRKSAGGFVHGFRYTGWVYTAYAVVLTKILSQR